jgi:hypothetical protein
MNSDTDTDTAIRLRQLSMHCYVDTRRISALEKELKEIRIRLYVFAATAFILAVVVAMVLVRATWHLWP